jgi:hypothetical protein
MSEQSDTIETEQTPDCPCDPAQIAWESENGEADEHQYVIPGTCTGCSNRWLFVYNEAGIKDAETKEYIREF